jgi:hypothetical protein
MTEGNMIAIKFAGAAGLLFLLIGWAIYRSTKSINQNAKKILDRPQSEEWDLIDPDGRLRESGFKLYRRVLLPGGLIDSYQYQNEMRQSIAVENAFCLSMSQTKKDLQIQYSDQNRSLNPNATKLTVTFSYGNLVKCAAKYAGGMRIEQRHSPVEIEIAGRKFTSKDQEIREAGELVGYEFVEMKDGLEALIAFSPEIPEEICAVMLYLVQAESRYLTGLSH